MNNCLTYDQAGEVLGISTRSVRRFVDKGMITPVKFGRSVRFRPDELERFQRFSEGWKKWTKPKLSHFVIVCVFLTACGESVSTSGSGQSKATHVENSKVMAAMNLLQSKYPQGHIYANRYISEITVDSGYSGVTDGVLNLPPGYVSQSSVQWLASAIVHDAAHVELGYGCSVAEEAEIILEVQMPALVAVGGSDYEIDYLKKQAGGHDCH